MCRGCASRKHKSTNAHTHTHSRARLTKRSSCRVSFHKQKRSPQAEICQFLLSAGADNNHIDKLLGRWLDASVWVSAQTRYVFSVHVIERNRIASIRILASYDNYADSVQLCVRCRIPGATLQRKGVLPNNLVCEP